MLLTVKMRKKLKINTEDIKDTNKTWIDKTSRDLPSPPHANHELRKAARQKKSIMKDTHGVDVKTIKHH